MDAETILLKRRRRSAATSDLGLIGSSLGLASLGIGVAGVVAPGVLGRLMGVERSTVWVIAVRDLASAWLILGWGGSLAFLVRAAFDMGDAAMMLRRRPVLALLAGGTSIVGLAKGLDLQD